MHERITNELVALFNKPVGGGCSGSAGGRKAIYIKLVVDIDRTRGLDGAR